MKTKDKLLMLMLASYFLTIVIVTIYTIAN